MGVDLDLSHGCFWTPPVQVCFVREFLFVIARSHKCGRLTDVDANVSLTAAARMR